MMRNYKRFMSDEMNYKRVFHTTFKKKFGEVKKE